MKVLMVLYKFGTPDEIGKNLGSFDYFLSQLSELKKHGVEITVLAPWVGFFKEGSKNVQGIPVIRYYPKMATRRLRNLLIYKLVNRIYIWRTTVKVLQVAAQGFNLIYVRQSRETGAAVARARSRLDLPTVFQPITTWQWHFEEAGDNFFKRIIKDTGNQKNYALEVLQQFDFFVTYNQTMREEYVKLGADPAKFVIIPGAVRSEIFQPLPEKQKIRQQLGLPQGKKIVLYIGRINFAEKGVDILVSAFKKVRAVFPDAYLVLIGPGTETEIGTLQKLIRDSGLDDTVVYLGSKAYNDLPAFINSADLGVVPSVWFESSGRVSLDMLSCGLPVIVTNVGGMAEYSVSGKTGFVIESKNTEALTSAIVKIFGDDVLRRQMAENARAHVMGNYTLEKTTEQFISFFNRILQNHVRH